MSKLFRSIVSRCRLLGKSCSEHTSVIPYPFEMMRSFDSLTFMEKISFSCGYCNHPPDHFHNMYAFRTFFALLQWLQVSYDLLQLSVW